MYSLLKWMIAISLLPVLANAEAVAISMKSKNKPASDLIDKNGKFISPSHAVSMPSNDVSLLDPMTDKMWAGSENNVVEFLNENGTSRSISLQLWGNGDNSVPAVKGNSGRYEATEKDDSVGFHARVESISQPGVYLRIGLSRYSHGAMMRSYLLRKLGYVTPVLTYHSAYKIYFKSEEEKKAFINSAEDATTTDLSSENKWITDNNKNDHSITMRNVVAEPILSDVFDISWGYAPRRCFEEGCKGQVAALNKLNEYRTYRALILAYALVDIPESINRFSPKFAAVDRNQIIINHEFAQSFFGATFEDMRWILRRLAKISSQDLREMVAQSGLDRRYQEIVYAKIIHRVNNALDLFGLKSLKSIKNPSLKISSGDGTVVDGKVMKNVETSPLRYFHGDRKSPYNEGDLRRALTIDGKSAAIQNVLTKVNDKLQLLTTQDAAEDRKNEILKRIMNHIKKSPDKPLHQDIESWGGPLLGLNVGTSRHVSTGTYFESTAPVQLVDEMTLSGSLGYFWVLDGIQNATPTYGAQITKNRTYAHVRPLAEIKDGDKSWKDIAVPHYMKNLGKMLASSTMISDGAAEVHPVDQFLKDLLPGEVFIITDSLSKTGYVQASSSITSLLGLDPVSFANSVSLGADYSVITTHQTVITKDMGGRVQVYVRKMNTDIKGLTFDINYYINLLRARAQSTIGDIHTDAFLIKYKIGDVEASENEAQAKKARESLRLALRGLFRHNDADLLYGKFQHNKIQVDHTIETDKIKTKILSYHKSKFDEKHCADVRFPANPKFAELNPDNEVISLCSSKYGELVGRNRFNLIFDFLDGYLGQKGKGLFRQETENPADMPYGRASWNIIDTNVDISKKIEQKQSTLTYKKIWGGWSIKKPAFDKLIEEIQKEVSGIAPYQIVDQTEFLNVKSVDFYRVTMNISFLDAGLKRLKDFVTQVASDGKPNYDFVKECCNPTFKKDHKPKKPHDFDLFKEVMTLIGKGDSEKGYSKYLSQCKSDRTRKHYLYDTPYVCLTYWMKNLIILSRNFPSDKKAQADWYTKVMKNLNGRVPLNGLLNRIGASNYMLVVNVNGFRVGDEDGDLDFYTNTVGDHSGNKGKDIEFANGLFQYYARKIGISTSELHRTQGGFQ